MSYGKEKESITMQYLAILILTCALTFAQSRETPVYLEQFQNLDTSVNRIASEVSQGKIRWDDQDNTASRIFALQKLVHRLQEEAGSADIDARSKGARTDKRLLLIQQGCMAMDYVLQALNSSVATDDRIFLSLATDGMQAVAGIRKVL